MSNPIATFTTSMGSFKCEILLDKVPRTASSFIDLAKSGFYDGLHFHRVIPGFMNQFGCPFSSDPNSKRSGTGGPKDGTFKNLATGNTEKRFGGGNIKDENIDRTPNAPGTLSMANTGAPNSGGSQFFLNVADNRTLDWFSKGSSKHPVFGKCVDKASLALCVRISKVPTRNDNPRKPIKMISVKISGGAEKAASAEGAGVANNPTAVFETSMGTMEAEILLDKVPRTASNFIDLCESGFYDGLHFHRVIPGFMNQFGCPYSRDPKSGRSGTGNPKDGTFKNLVTGETEKRFGGGNIKDENIDRTSNASGTLSMANTGERNSGGSQFFLNVADNRNLDWFSKGSSKHPVFGKVTKNLPLAVKISKVPTREDNPRTPIKMISIKIVRGGKRKSEGGVDGDFPAKRRHA